MTNAEKIEDLRSRGIYPFVQHLRDEEVLHPEKMDGGQRRLAARGGRTIVRLYDAHTYKQYATSPVDTEPPKLLAQGFSICHPLDNYDRKRGLTIALGRAIKDLETPKREHDLVTAEDAAELLERAREELVAS